MIFKHWKGKTKLLSYFSFTHDYAAIYQQNETRTSDWDYLLYSKAIYFLFTSPGTVSLLWLVSHLCPKSFQERIKLSFVLFPFMK